MEKIRIFLVLYIFGHEDGFFLENYKAQFCRLGQDLQLCRRHASQILISFRDMSDTKIDSLAERRTLGYTHKITFSFTTRIVAILC